MYFDRLIQWSIHASVDFSDGIDYLLFSFDVSRVISSFSVSFSVISVLTGITTLYNTGLEFGGPVTMIYGWPIAGAFTLMVGLAMSEICSAYPTSGGLYFWSAKLCGNRWGPFASWITGWWVLHPSHQWIVMLLHSFLHLIVKFHSNVVHDCFFSNASFMEFPVFFSSLLECRYLFLFTLDLLLHGSLAG